jgi:predicted RNA-binding protein YlxR (DUF448 family)
MMRFVRAPDGALAFDVLARLPSRGAWTCASGACVRRALDTGAFPRNFEAPVLVDKGALEAEVGRILDEEALSRVGLCRRAGVLAAGRTEVSDAVAAGTVAAVIVASDLADRSREGLPATAVAGPSMERLGIAVGRPPTGILGILGRGPLVLATRAAFERRARFFGLLELGDPIPTARAVTSEKGALPPCDGVDQSV